jgi:hypothetical protein
VREIVKELNEKLSFGIVALCETDLYFRYDFDSTDGDGSWEEYLYCVEELEKHGYEFIYEEDWLRQPYIEHDCVSGLIKEKTDETD